MSRIRKPLFVAGGILAVLLGAFALVGIARAQTGTPEDPFVLYNTPTVSIRFDPYDATENIKWIEYQMSTAAGDYSNPVVDVQHELSSPTDNHIPIYESISGLDNGTYYLRVRVIRSNGEMSAWAQYVATKSWGGPPEAPVCTIVIRIVVEVNPGQ
jgi:hypothetical protein